MCSQFYVMIQGRKHTIHPSDTYKIMVYDNHKFSYQKATFGLKTKQNLIINARCETVSSKPCFKDLTPCLILASGYHEWDAAKMKMDIYKENDEILYLAGLYHKQGDCYEYVIITTYANPSVSMIHNRMPLVLNKKQAEAWIKNEHQEEILQSVPTNMIYSQKISQMSLEM